MPTDRETWPTAMATVAECHYDVRAGRAIAFGLPSGKNFRIRYNYNADGQLHTGEFYSATAIPQNTLFPIRYDPAATHDHTHEQLRRTRHSQPPPRHAPHWHNRLRDALTRLVP